MRTQNQARLLSDKLGMNLPAARNGGWLSTGKTVTCKSQTGRLFLSPALLPPLPVSSSETTKVTVSWRGVSPTSWPATRLLSAESRQATLHRRGRLTGVSVGHGPSSNLSLHKAVHDASPAEHHAVTGLPGDQEEQATVGRVGVSGAEEVRSDDYLLSLWTTEDRFQTWSQHRDLIIDGIHLETEPQSGPPWLGGEDQKESSYLHCQDERDRVGSVCGREV